MSGQSSGSGFLMSAVVHGDSLLNEQEKELSQRLRRLYPAVNENETPLPRSWSPKDKFRYVGLSQNNLRVHYKGHGKTPKDAASVRATHPIPAACGVYYFEVTIISKGRDGYIGIGLSAQGVSMNRLPGETPSPACLSARLSACLSVCLSAAVCLSVCLSICLSACCCLSACLTVCRLSV
ncbi:Ran-binding protein 9 [Takifugu flavidus]|uniref:Ran-binding protein 9 n=1 Tax=Takifugu flavidus TaxID=433684 RepID=A0A5C6MGX3_9TELE|nr:Ran-binding protein 9 [Takifugu flavidus]